MNFQYVCKLMFIFFLLALCAHPVLSQDSVQTSKQKKSSPNGLMLKLSDQDFILPITSIEWGTPDRWSITSRYVHMLEKDRDNKTWLNNLSVALSPGTAGGRFTIGYEGIFTPRSMPDFAIFSEVRLALLRTWGNPLSTIAHRTFVGAEIRASLSWLFNMSLGYYEQISKSKGGRQHFFSWHLGIGI